MLRVGNDTVTGTFPTRSDAYEFVIKWLTIMLPGVRTWPDPQHYGYENPVSIQIIPRKENTNES